MASTTIQIRIDSKVKKEARKLFGSLGTDISSATKMFIAQSIKTQTLAVKGLTENGFTEKEERRILRAVEASKNSKNLSKKYSDVEELIRDLRK
jgi:DNA-damage-inducible protein J